MTLLLEDLLKLIVAVGISGLVGAERELRDKAAGFRTIILICVGSTLFTIFSIKIGGDGDRVRIAANIVSGIGFLGAGVILRERDRITGLTTASTIWLAAALGMGIGGGYYLFTGAAAGIILVVLLLFPKFEERIDIGQETRTYQIISKMNREKLVQLDAIFRQHGLRVKSHKQSKRDGEMICTWEVHGPSRNHDRCMKVLFADDDVKELRF